MMNQAESAAVAPSQLHEVSTSQPTGAGTGSGPHSIRAGRPEASAAIWSWRDAGTTGAKGGAKPSAIRLRGGLKALIPAVIGSVIYLRVSHLGGTIVLSVAAVIFMAAMLSPTGLYALIDRAFNALTDGVGRLMTWIVLPILFFTVFLPFGKVTRRGKQDRLQRFHDAARASYWSDRTGERAASANRGRQY
jgi:hypothetical protein